MTSLRRARSLLLVPLLLAACDSGTAPSVPTTVSATTPLEQTAVAGTAVASAPGVRVVDQRGQAMAGVSVTFAVTAGGGAVTNGAVATDAQGIASAGTWTLGAAGPQAVTATVAGVAPVQFAATAQARTAAQVVAVSAVAQSAPTGTPVADPPAVRVDDQTGQPLPGVQVVFGVSAGGGSLTGGTATTDAGGVARVGSWTLGAAAGTQTVVATVAGIAPVQFTATATASTNPCATAVAYTVFSSVAGSLAQGDCLQQGYLVDLYRMDLASATGATYRMTSQAFDAWLEVYDRHGNLVAVNDDETATTTDAAVPLFAPDGGYFLAATSFAPGETGSYLLFSDPLAGNDGCGDVWVVRGVTVPGSLDAGDCNFGGYLADDYLVILYPGQRLHVRMASSAVDAYLELYDSEMNLVAEDDDGGGGTDAQLSYTATGLDLFLLSATTFSAGETGAYTLRVEDPIGGEIPPLLAPAGQAPELRRVLSGRTPKAEAAALRAARAPAARRAKAESRR